MTSHAGRPVEAGERSRWSTSSAAKNLPRRAPVARRRRPAYSRPSRAGTARLDNQDSGRTARTRPSAPACYWSKVSKQAPPSADSPRERQDSPADRRGGVDGAYLSYCANRSILPTAHLSRSCYAEMLNPRRGSARSQATASLVTSIGGISREQQRPTEERRRLLVQSTIRPTSWRCRTCFRTSGGLLPYR